jgi:hypothetical protein
MSSNRRPANSPEAFCNFCSMKTPHRYERLAVDRRQVSRATCLACNMVRPKDVPGSEKFAASPPTSSA